MLKWSRINYHPNLPLGADGRRVTAGPEHHFGKALFEVFKYLGVQDIGYNQPKSLPYPTENPFA